MEDYLQSFNMIVEQAHLCFKEKTTAVNLGAVSFFFIAARKLGSYFQQSGGVVSWPQVRIYNRGEEEFRLD